MAKLFPDGRKTAYTIAPKRQERFVRNSEVAMLIEHFEKTGQSTHSHMALTLQYIIDYCETNNQPYIVTAVPGTGYSIKKADEFGRPLDGPRRYIARAAYDPDPNTELAFLCVYLNVEESIKYKEAQRLPDYIKDRLKRLGFDLDQDYGVVETDPLRLGIVQYYRLEKA